MTMLHVIDLAVLDAIFSLGDHKLSAKARALYVNCLTFHFRSLPNIESASVSWTIGYDLVNHDKFKRQFDELAANKLITYHEKVIRFENVWSKFVDKSRYEIKSSLTNLTLEQIESQILANRTTIETICMRHRITEKVLSDELRLFVLEKKAEQINYEDVTKAIRHFIFWLGKRISQHPNAKKKIVSNSQILGYE